MEQHPVPQNVTTFQFRLIGDMTIKQFGYLAGGAILAYISYILPLPFFFTWPLTVIFAFLGVGFAFIPVEERPMDIWVLSFLKSVYAPTQFVWHRTQQSTPVQKPTVIPPTTSAALTQKTVLSQSQTQIPAPATLQSQASKPITAALQGFYTPSSSIPKKSFLDSLFSWVDTLFSPPKTHVQNAPTRITQTPPPQQIPTQRVVTETITQTVPPPSIEKNPELERLQEEISKLQTALTNKTNVEDRVLELQKEMTEMQKQKQEMEARLLSMKKHSTATPQEKPSLPAGVVPPPAAGPTVKVIPPDVAVRAGLPKLTTFPNVVTGIIKDNQGGLLPGVLVTVRDKEGIPLRALKTNKIGQFAASTQLPNGVFFVEVEDPRGRYMFDRAQITLNGSVMPAIEIVAKSKRDIDREVLVKQIFGQTPNT